jgi:hypothetical protein
MTTRVSKVSIDAAEDPLSLFAAQKLSTDDDAEATDSNSAQFDSPAPPSTTQSFTERVAAVEKSTAEISATLSIPTSISSHDRTDSSAERGSNLDVHNKDADLSQSRSDATQTSSSTSPMASSSSSGVSVDSKATHAVAPEEEVELYTGEMHLMKLKNVSLVKASGRHIPITLLMTTYRMMLMPTRSHAMALAQANPSVLSQLTIPLGTIEKIEKEKKKSTGTTIVVQCKDIRYFRIYIPGVGDEIATTGITIMSDWEVERALGAMQAYSFPTDIRYVFAFAEAAALKHSDKQKHQHFRYDFTVREHMNELHVWRFK